MPGSVDVAQTDSVTNTQAFQKSTAGAAHVIALFGYPAGATAVAASSGNVAAAVATATLPAVVGKTNYVTGFEITGAGATAAAIVLATLSGLVGGATLTYAVAVPAGASVGITPISVQFSQPVPANAANTAISASVPSFGAGNTNAVVNIHGFVL